MARVRLVRVVGERAIAVSLISMLCCPLWCNVGRAAETGGATASPDLSLVFSAGSEVVLAGERAEFWLNVLNTSATEVSWHFRGSTPCRIRTDGASFDRALQLVAVAPISKFGSGPAAAAGPEAGGMIKIPSGGFVRARYWVTIPSEALGQVVLDFPELPCNAVAVQSIRPAAVAVARGKGMKEALQHAEPAPPDKPFDPAGYFRKHLAPYEPIYFIAGPDSPNAKFQFSFKYQLLSSEAPLAERSPWLKGLNLAYTQTSLWDWSRASAPFLDSSYKPELLYLWRDAYRNDESHFRLDLQPGFQHESNGKDGEDSRSLNIVYLRPTLTFGKPDKLQLILQPRAWAYVGDLSDNDDIARYRGYADLRGILGWQRGVQLSAIGRMGDHADKGSVQLDLSYPMLRIWSSFSVYLDVQFFTGYGESLLLYNERSWAVRGGFSLFR